VKKHFAIRKQSFYLCAPFRGKRENKPVKSGVILKEFIDRMQVKERGKALLDASLAGEIEVNRY
jgi:hypothetical protein